jgi:predicted aldo/keto reductase-like oxidoreductase
LRDGTFDAESHGQIIPVIHEALDQGVNYFDLIVGNPEVKDLFGKGFKGKRDKVILAGHLGCSERNGQYYKTRDRNECQELFDDLLKRLQTDYLDILHLHNVDEKKDYEQIIGPAGILEIAQRLKKEGKIRFIGFSGHNISRCPFGVDVIEKMKQMTQLFR